MSKRSYLKECIRALVNEAQKVIMPMPVFELIDEVKIVPGTAEGYFVTKRISLKMSEELMVRFGFTVEEAKELQSEVNGVVSDDWDLIINPEIHYEPGQKSPNRYEYPDDPEQFIIEDYRVSGILTMNKGTMVLSKEDSLRLAEYLGPLTDDEVESIREQHLGDLESPDYEPDYNDY